MAQAACPWTPPTADQPGLLGTNWSKCWIIEDCDIHDAKCSAISIGKEESTGHNMCTRTQRKPGYQYQMEAVFRAARIGWSREIIGSHLIRRNVLHDCGQNGIVGHMGCIFSTIEQNHIYNIAVKHEFFGYEIAGIKLHAAIDVTIRHNNIHNSALGTWLDWQAQGAHVHNNLYYANDRDLMIEVTHGPYLVENNIFIGGSKAEADDASCGTAGYDKHPHGWEAYQALLKAYGNGDHEKFQDTPQAVYIAGNAYLNGAPAYVHETELCTSDEDCAFRISEEADGTYLEIQIPASLLDLKTTIVSTDTLGSTRITEGLYEDKNGNPYVIDYDFLGHSRGDTPVAGPFEVLKVGLNRIKVW